MSYVLISTLSWGVIWQVNESNGLLNIPAAGIEAEIDTTVYEDDAGVTPMDPGDFVTDAYGGLPGYVAVNDDSTPAYFISVAGGDPIEVHAVGKEPAGGGGGSVQAWQPLTLEDGWSDYDADCSYYKHDDRVFLKGVIYNDGDGDAELPLILPVGYRPADTVRLVLHTVQPDTDPSTYGEWWSVIIETDGEFRFKQNDTFSGSPNFGMPPTDSVFSIETISFRIG